MRHQLAAMLLIALAGCDHVPPPAGPPGKTSGRYAGIGVYDAGRLWSQIADRPEAKDPALAGIADDEPIIVVVDSHTGEVRQCGDHSGYCVAMNPWRSSGTTLPLKLGKHAEDLAADDVANAAAPAVTDRPGG
ncbi:hypothetical protein [Sphingosinicella sp. BN140058]|uniref:hypothetical protein n=1 Tax=Sphingosinicella sp. BN140058 TaxID=1892855 RepID=UPI001012FB09|nr:hypothetical protein [Sphingosinicella sp. BN140058]QAY76411.1 hypothetical protein ETR14_07830 [Sphingosinicella sp. BN140058]